MSIPITEFLPGTLLFRKDVYTGLVEHYGILLQASQSWVAHIDKSESGHLRVKTESFEEFAAGLPVKAEPVQIAVPIEEMWNRIEWVRQNRIPYGMLEWGQSWNCETFARYARDGVPQSTQASNANGFLAATLFGFGALGVLAMAASALSGGADGCEAEANKAFEEKSFDQRVQRYRDSRGRFASGE